MPISSIASLEAVGTPIIVPTNTNPSPIISAIIVKIDACWSGDIKNSPAVHSANVARLRLFRVRKKNPSNDADGFNLQVRLLVAIGRSRAIVPLNVYSNSHVTRARTI